MKAVVDTNVVAYLLLGTERFVDEARACFNAVSNPIAPAHWEAEFTHVVWMAVRSGILPPARPRTPQPGEAPRRRIGDDRHLVPGCLAPIGRLRHRRVRHALRRTGGAYRLPAAHVRQGVDQGISRYRSPPARSARRLSPSAQRLQLSRGALDRMRRRLQLLLGGSSNFLDPWAGPAPGVPEREHIDTVALSLVVIVEVISNAPQEWPSNAREPGMRYRLSDRRQQRDKFQAALQIIGEGVGRLLSMLKPPLRCSSNLHCCTGREPHTKAQPSVRLRRLATRS